MGHKQYFVYMMTNFRQTVLYTGVTNSLERRMWQHKQGTFAGFTKQYKCDRLVHFEEYGEIDQAIAREKQIKGWTRAKKNALVATANPGWRDLAAEWYDEDPSVILSPAEGEGPSPEPHKKVLRRLRDSG